jgi:hypothetical protein
MPIDKSIYRGFLNTLDNARKNKYLVTLHFFRDPTLRGYIENIDSEVYVATILSEEGNFSQIRLSQITSITWRKNGEIILTPKNLNSKNRKKAIITEKIEREKLEETATDYMKKNPHEKEVDKKIGE